MRIEFLFPLSPGFWDHLAGIEWRCGLSKAVEIVSFGYVSHGEASFLLQGSLEVIYMHFCWWGRLGEWGGGREGVYRENDVRAH